MFNHKIIFRFFSMIFIFGIFFGLANVSAIENGFKVCSPQGSTCSPNKCRTSPSTSYSIDSNGGTKRVSASTWFINGYFNTTAGQSDQDKSKCDLFINRYGLSYSNPRQIQQKINKLAEVYPSKCSITCEDGRFGNDTISKMGSCMCADADDKPDNAGNCGQGFTGDGKGCCIKYCAPPSILATSGSCALGSDLVNGCCVPKDCSGTGKTSYTNNSCPSGFTGDGAGCCTINCPSLGKSNPPCNPGFTIGTNGCCEQPAGCSKPTTGASNDCSGRGNGWILDTTIPGCCKQCANSPISGTCSGKYELKNNCCEEKTCTNSGEVLQASGDNYTCRPCGSGFVAQNGKCVCDSSQKCCGIELNTVVPFIGDCIEMSNDESSANTTRVTALNAFPRLMGGLSKIVITAILIFSFVMVVVGGVMITAGGIKQENYSKGIDIIQKVIIALALLGASGIILHLINPSFFK